MIDITGIDRVKLLQSLYRNTRPLGMGILHDQPGGLTYELARSALSHATGGSDTADCWFDYIAGRPIKVSFRGNELHADTIYDRDAGQGACQRAVDEARGAP